MNYQKIKLLGGAEVSVDMDAPRKKCKKCNTLIRWGLTVTGRSMPVVEILNLVNHQKRWQSHFADCKFASSFRKSESDRETQYREEDENQAALNNL